jgi:hypothetical protein
MRPIPLLLGLALLTSPASAEEKMWGTVKGRIVYDGIPPARKVIDKAQADAKCVACAAMGKTLDNEWVVDPKTKGVRGVMVWLLHESGNFDRAIPIHPALAKPEPKVVLDQPCCLFEPRLLGMRAGQTLVCRNSAKFPHNVKIDGVDDNPGLNQLVQPGTELEVKGWTASRFAVPVSCTLHPWMSARIRVFDHPYFTLTNDRGEFEIKNAPAGKFRIVVWNNQWLVSDPKKETGAAGIPLEIRPDGVTDLGEIKVKRE